MAKQMTLTEYLTGRTADYRSNFHTFIATLPNGGRITAHHNRDKSTEKYFAEMSEGQFLISYNLPNGEHKRCEIALGGEPVTVRKGR